MTTATESRIETMREQHKTMSLSEIGKVHGNITAQRVSQLIGVTGKTKDAGLLRAILVYRYIEAYKKEHKYPPSMGDIRKKFPTDENKPRSFSVVQKWLVNMRNWKLIEPVKPRVSRSIVLLPLDKSRKIVQEMLKLEKENGNVTG